MLTEQLRSQLEVVISDYHNSKYHKSLAQAHKVLQNIQQYQEEFLLDHPTDDLSDERLNIERLLAEAENTLGQILLKFNDLQLAEQHILQALTICESCHIHEPIMLKSIAGLGGVYLRRGEFMEALRYFEKGLTEAEFQCNSEFIEFFTGNIGMIMMKRMDSELALFYLHKAIDIAEQYSRKNRLSHWIGSIGILYSNVSEYDKALEYLQRAYELDQENGFQEGAILWLNNIAEVYDLAGIFSRSIEIKHKLLQISRESKVDAEIAISLHNLYLTYARLGDYESGLQYITEAFHISQIQDRKELIVNIYLNYCNCMVALKKYADIEEILQNAYEISKDLNLAFEIGNSLFALAKFWGNTDNPAFNVQKAIETGIQSVSVFQEIGNKYYESKVHSLLLNCYANLEDWKKAFQHQKQLHELYKSLHEKEIEKAVHRKTLELLEREKNDLEIKNEELKQLNDEKNEILGIVAHDLKNPIGSVLNIVPLLQNLDSLTSNEHDPEREELYGFITSSCKRMLDLIINLLDVNKLETGKIQAKNELVNISELAEVLIFQNKSTAEKKSITIHSEIAREMFIQADNTLVRNIFENLISNAIKFSPLEKEIFVFVHEVLDGEKGKFVQFKIQDQGPGLSEADQRKLFGKFAKLTPRPTGGEHSSGLGLSIVKKLAEMMKGTVWCESQEGNGAAFFVRFPKKTVTL